MEKVLSDIKYLSGKISCGFGGDDEKMDGGKRPRN